MWRANSFWWLYVRGNTRSHPEHDREDRTADDSIANAKVGDCQIFLYLSALRCGEVFLCATIFFAAVQSRIAADFSGATDVSLFTGQAHRVGMTEFDFITVMKPLLSDW